MMFKAQSQEVRQRSRWMAGIRGPSQKDSLAGSTTQARLLLPPLSISPLLALYALFAGVVCALVTLPQDVEPHVALRLPVFCMVAGIASPVLAAIARDPKALLRAEYVVALSPIFWLLLDPIQGRYDLSGISTQDVQQSVLAIGLFVSGVWLATIPARWQLPRAIQRAATRELSSAAWFMMGLVGFSLAFLRFAIPSDFDLVKMFAALAGGRWEAPWARGNLGGADAILDHLSYFGFLLPPITVLLARRAGWRDGRTLTLMVLSLIIALFLSQGGGRRIVGVLFASAATLWFLGQPRIRPRTLIALVASMIFLISLLELLLDYRNLGWKAYFDPESQELIQATKEEEAFIRVDDNFLRLAQIVSIFPDTHPYVTWRYLLWVAVRPIPRFLWPGKPLDPGFVLSQLVDFEGASLSASAIGELFATGGFLAVFLGGILFGRLAGMLSRLLEESDHECALLIYSLGLLALFVGMRSMIELVLMSYTVIAWTVLSYAVGMVRGKRMTPMSHASTSNS